MSGDLNPTKKEVKTKTSMLFGDGLDDDLFDPFAKPTQQSSASSMKTVSRNGDVCGMWERCGMVLELAHKNEFNISSLYYQTPTPSSSTSSSYKVNSGGTASL